MDSLITELTKTNSYFKTAEEIATKRYCELDDNERFVKHMIYSPKKAHGRSRVKREVYRLDHGATVQPRGKECYAWGEFIITRDNHESMKNSELLVDDAEFLIYAATITPDPTTVDHFFFNYINQYLKNNFNFRLEFLKAIYLNKNILPVSSISAFVQSYHFEAENNTLLVDETFLATLENKFALLKQIKFNKEEYEAIKFKDAKRKYKKDINQQNVDRKERVDAILNLFKESIKQKNLRDEQLKNLAAENLLPFASELI